jgi:hypothetical protein
MPNQEIVIIASSVVFCLGVVFKGFFSAAGKDLWAITKLKFKGIVKSDFEVETDFKPKIYKVQNCTWIPEENLENKENHKWKYYPHLKSGGRCYRLVGEGKFAKKEYYMVTPNAERI